ncbi:tyrosine-protein phosphatase [Nocardioides pacificus]
MSLSTPRPDESRELLRLASADNFRDVAGPGEGWRLPDGGRVRRGVFYRSNELRLTDEDAAAVSGLGLSIVHDLRSPHEIAEHPDPEIAGVRWQNLDVLGIPMAEVTGLGDRGESLALMARVYRGFVTDPGAREGFGRLLTDLADQPAPQLFHCSAGKDRTGWASALVLHVAGVDEEQVMADYLLTDDYARSSRERYLAMITESWGPERAAVFEPVLTVSPDYLDVARAQADASYGGLDGYLAEGLGLSGATLARLAARLRP